MGICSGTEQEENKGHKLELGEFDFRAPLSENLSEEEKKTIWDLLADEDEQKRISK